MTSLFQSGLAHMPGNARSLTHRTIHGALWLTAGKIAYAVVQLGVLAVLGRLLTPAEFGVVSAALLIIAFSAIFSQLGVGPAVRRLGPSWPVKSRSRASRQRSCCTGFAPPCCICPNDAPSHNLIVGHLLGPAALGIYGRAYQLMSAPA
ncbi:MAG: oligosaccharide flippase family protein [Gemmatimonadales bacterium]